MKLNKKSLADQIAQHIKNRIVNIDIEPGEKINLSDFEEEFGVSRAPVREALQSLVDQGLVQVRPRVGYFAVELTPKQIKDICELRKLLESFALKQSIDQIPRNRLDELREKTLELKNEQLPQKELRDKFDRTDEEIHKLIIQNSSNEFLKDFTERLHNLIALTRHLNKRIQEANKEHLKMLNAMVDRDLQLAKRELETHLDNVEAKIMESLEED